MKKSVIETCETPGVGSSGDRKLIGARTFSDGTHSGTNPKFGRRPPATLPRLLRRIVVPAIVVAAVRCSAAHAQPVTDPSPDPTAAQPVAHQKIERTPIVIAHRGASGYLPEHTTEAAAFAHALGADFIEQDAVLSRDGIPVVLHDIILDDVTSVAAVFPNRSRDDGHWYVMDFTLAELRRLAVHERSSESRAWKDAGTRFPLDTDLFRIATLEEHLRLIQGLNKSRGTNTGVYVEVKSPAEHRAAGLDASRAILHVLNEAGYRDADDRIFLQCFDESEVRRLRTELDCRLPLIQLLSKQPSTEQIARIAEVADGLGLHLEAVIAGSRETPEGSVPDVTDAVRVAHEHALQVHVWTLRTDALPMFAESAGQLLNWLGKDAGVDGIFTDQPDIVLNWRRSVEDGALQKGPFHLLNGRQNSKTEEEQ
ncbi:MAG: glycerophosphodiester phosphodiesterase [Planctomycetaceae bacterium]